MACERTGDLPAFNGINFDVSVHCPVNWMVQGLGVFRREQCGKGVFCRDAAAQLQRLTCDIQDGRGRSEDIDLMIDIFTALQNARTCDLSVAAADTLLPLLTEYRKEWEAHILRKRCRLGICPKLKSGGPAARGIGLGTASRGSRGLGRMIQVPDHPLPANQQEAPRQVVDRIQVETGDRISRTADVPSLSRPVKPGMTGLRRRVMAEKQQQECSSSEGESNE